MQEWLTWQWDLDLTVLLPVLLLSYTLGWAWLRHKGNKAASTGRLICWAAGVATIAVATMSAIDTLASTYFAVHMVQHVLFIDVAAPLMLLGRPLSIWLEVFPPGTSGLPKWQNSLFNGMAFLFKPAVAWGISSVILLAWHVPWLYDYALMHPNVHVYGEHVSLFLAFVIWWHPLIGSLPRFSYLDTAKSRFVYLLAGMAPLTALGVFILFFPGVLYTFYQGVQPAASLIPDQQIGAAIMMFSGTVVLFVMGLHLQYIEKVPLTYP